MSATDSKETPQPQQETEPTPSKPPEAKSSSGSGFFWFLLLVLLGGGGYAYTKGWLDKPLELVAGSGTGAATAAPSAPASTSSNAASPAPAPAKPADSIRNEPLLQQVEVLQSRVIDLENTSRRLQAINEDLAAKVVRQSGSGGEQQAELDLLPLRLEIIDLRLRLTGNTVAAIRQLETIEATLATDGELKQLVVSNRQRLAQIPQRQQVLDLIDQLRTLIATAEADTSARLQSSENSADEVLGDIGVIGSLFKVSKEDTELRAEAQLAADLAATVEPVRIALLTSDKDSYLPALQKVQQAIDALAQHRSSLHSAEIASVVSQLVAIGYPAAHLVLLAPDAQGQS